VVHRPEPPDGERGPHPPRLAREEVKALLELSRTMSPDAGLRITRLLLVPVAYALALRIWPLLWSWPLVALGTGVLFTLVAWEIRRWRESLRDVEPPAPPEEPPAEPPELP
jgi:hypothetical protein